MLPFHGFVYKPSLVNLMDGGESILSSGSKSSEECKAKRTHKEAERRRRHRINNHLSTLRSLLPNVTKTDKASLLAEVVRHVKELRRKAVDVARTEGSPGEVDEATVSYCCGEDDDDGERMMKVTVCCDDRPGLNRDLSQAIRSIRAKVVQAEMVTVGGRTKTVVVMRSGGGDFREEEIGTLKRALKAVVDNRACIGPTQL